MIFAGILVYFVKERFIGGDGMFGFGFLAALEICAELVFMGALICR